MKREKVFILFFALVLSLPCFIFAAEIAVDSKITEVTVYPDSALITRSSGIKLNAGEQTVIFSDIIPEIDENSLRVFATDTVNIKILAANVKKEFLKEDAAQRVKQLRDQIQGAEDEIKKLENAKIILIEEKQFLDSIRLFSNGQIPKDLVTKMPAVKDLDDMYKFLDAKLKENISQVIDLELQTREVDRQLEVLKRELVQVSGPPRKLKRSIAVDLEVLHPVNFDLKVSYLVRGAFWQPVYDARANFDKSEVELISYGLIKQTTGEVWPDVDIALSTARPAIGGRMPYVEPWFLRPYQPSRIMSSRGFAGGMAKMAMQSEAFDMEPKKEVAAEAPIYSQVAERGVAVVYKLTKKATIKSDGSEHKLSVSTQNLKAQFEYSTYPRAILNAYLGSRVINAPNLQLLGGRVNIFLDGEFVGASSIDSIGPGEEFDLYLGVDENVKVKRERIEKKVDETLIAGIPAATKRTVIKYKLSTENYKSKKINVKLFEAMPIPEDDRIKVRIDKVSLEPKDKDWKDRKGVWLWELELEPKAKSEITYTQIIEHPREMQIEGL